MVPLFKNERINWLLIKAFILYSKDNVKEKQVILPGIYTGYNSHGCNGTQKFDIRKFHVKRHQFVNFDNNGNIIVCRDRLM